MKYTNWETLSGRKVIAVDGSTIFLEDGRAFCFELDGDCCSRSEYTAEGLAAFRELAGSTIASIEERNGESHEGLSEQYPEDDHDSWHFLVITTDKGHVTIDWRNSSNGYYDGNCFLSEATPLHPVVNDAILDGQDAAAVNALVDRIAVGERRQEIALLWRDTPAPAKVEYALTVK